MPINRSTNGWDRGTCVGLDFVDFQNPQVRRPTMRLEQGIVIRAEMSRCDPTMNGGVEHAAKVGARDGAAVHAEADEATRELVHDHEDPVAPEHDGFASEEVHAPEAVSGVSDERQPRGPGSARGGAIVFRHTRYTTFLSMSTPNVCEMMRAIRGQPNRGFATWLNDGLDECLARPLRSGLLGARAR